MTGTLKTRMGCLIVRRYRAYHGMGAHDPEGVEAGFQITVVKIKRRKSTLTARLYRALQNASSRPAIAGGADMHPDAVEPQAKQPLLLIGAVEHLGQRELARRRIGEQRRAT